MKVYVKENREIPPGYTYTRCDTYTAEELIVACSMLNLEGFTRVGWRNPYAEAYVKMHPKAEYTVEDKVAIMAMMAQNVDLEKALRKPRRRKAAV